MLRAFRTLRPKLIKATVLAEPAAALPARFFSALPRHEYKVPAYTRTKAGQIPMSRSYHGRNSHNQKHDDGKKFAITAAVASSLAAGLYVAHDYSEAKKGTKKHSSEKPLSKLDFLYIKMANDEKERRELGLIPDKLFEAGQKAIANNSNPEKWFDEMLLVIPNSSEVPLFNKVAEFYYSNGKIEKAIKFWERINEAENMGPYYVRAAEAFFKNQEFAAAEAYWIKAKVPMGQKYAQLGRACYEQKQLKQAVTFLESARQNDYQSYEMLMQLGHIYLRNHEVKHSEALELFKAALEFKTDNPTVNRKNAITLNEIGVCIFMNALALQNKNFKEQQLLAISYFERATALCPDDPVITMNLEIVKILNETPIYGFPHRYLQCKDSEPTAMFDAIKIELIRYKTQTISGSGVGFGATPTYDSKGNYSGAKPVMTSTSCSMDVPRYENVLALDKLADLELRQLRKRETLATQMSVVMK